MQPLSVEFRPVKAGSLRSQVAEALREAILGGRLAPGSVLRETHLAASFGVSQPTIREALMTLEHAGLVVRNPNRDTVVTTLTAKDVQERSRLRILLEGMAAVDAAANMTEEDFAVLQSKLDEIHEALDRDIYLDYTAADLAFHRFIWEKSGDKTLCKMLDLITVPVFAFLNIRRSRTLHNIVSVVRSHDPIVAAMRSRDDAAIREAFRQHIAGSYEQFRDDRSL